MLSAIRDELKAGNRYVRYSKRFARLEEFFIDDRCWQGMREDFFRRSGLPSDTSQVREYPGAAHGPTATHQDEVNNDLLSFLQVKQAALYCHGSGVLRRKFFGLQIVVAHNTLRTMNYKIQ
jgi:hypothetical protein